MKYVSKDMDAYFPPFFFSFLKYSEFDLQFLT